jgi:hypothetical protein
MRMTLVGRHQVKMSGKVAFEPQARTLPRRTCLTYRCNTLHLSLL